MNAVKGYGCQQLSWKLRVVIESWSGKDQSGGRGDEEKRVMGVELAGLTVEDAGQGVT